MEPFGFPLILSSVWSWASMSGKGTWGQLKQVLGALVSVNQSSYTRPLSLLGMDVIKKMWISEGMSFHAVSYSVGQTQLWIKEFLEQGAMIFFFLNINH